MVKFIVKIYHLFSFMSIRSFDKTQQIYFMKSGILIHEK